jgi:hypothetical protein
MQFISCFMKSFALFVHQLLNFKEIKLRKEKNYVLREYFLFAKFLTNCHLITILEQKNTPNNTHF